MLSQHDEKKADFVDCKKKLLKISNLQDKFHFCEHLKIGERNPLYVINFFPTFLLISLLI